VVANHDDSVVWIQFLVRPGRHFPHGHGDGTWKAAYTGLPGLPYIQQQGLFLTRQHASKVLWDEFKI
jgi:hypothetical protein